MSVTTLHAAGASSISKPEGALWRMEDGHYGRCVTCDGPVELERLEILPQTAQCMACQRGPSR